MNITESVARLHRAGSEHSKSADKLREAVDNLLRWMQQNVPSDLTLPQRCMWSPSHNFSQMERVGVGGYRFTIHIGEPHSRELLLKFSKLIANGFLEELSALLEKDAGTFCSTTAKIDGFVAAKS